MADLILKEESYKIIGACFEVYNKKGFGFTEPVYQECLQIEFDMQRIPFVAQTRDTVGLQRQFVSSILQARFHLLRQGSARDQNSFVDH